MRTGWMCPACGKAHAPDVETCPSAAGYQPFISYPPVFYPAAPVNPWMPPYIVTCSSDNSGNWAVDPVAMTYGPDH